MFKKIIDTSSTKVASPCFKSSSPFFPPLRFLSRFPVPLHKKRAQKRGRKRARISRFLASPAEKDAKEEGNLMRCNKLLLMLLLSCRFGSSPHSHFPNTNNKKRAPIFFVPTSWDLRCKQLYFKNLSFPFFEKRNNLYLITLHWLFSPANLASLSSCPKVFFRGRFRSFLRAIKLSKKLGKARVGKNFFLQLRLWHTKKGEMKEAIKR